MLELKNVSFKYRHNLPWIIDNININIKNNEIIGISGDSGKGKTTIAKIMAGFLKPQRGEVLFDRESLPTKGYCPVQLIFQHPEFAVNPKWNLKMILGEIDGFFPDKEILDLLSINPLWMDRFPHELSGGELQRIAVARILNPKTRFIIADEMTSMLDAITQAQIWNAIINFSKINNVGIIAISHDYDLLDRICTRIEKLS